MEGKQDELFTGPTLQKIEDMMEYAYPVLQQFPKSEKFAMAADIKLVMDVMLEKAVEAQKKILQKDHVAGTGRCKHKIAALPACGISTAVCFYAQVRGMEQAACRNRKVVGELAQYRQGQLENIGNQPSRAFFSGCSWNNPSNGLGSFNGNNPRSNVDDDIGFRAALPPSQILQAQGLALSAEVIKGLVPLVAFRGLKILASQSAFRRYKRTAHAVRRPQGVGFFGKAPTRFRAFCNVRQFV